MPEENVSADKLTVGSSYQVALGQSETTVLRNLGQPTAQDVMPQGYTAYVYNPGGNYDSYFHVYILDGIVVGMSVVSPDFSYGDIISSGSALPSGCSSLGYDYKNGYKLATTDANILLYTDLQADSKVYGIQVFSDLLSLNDIMRPQDIKENYSSAVAQSMTRQMAEWVNAFRSYKGIAVKCTQKGTTAQEHSDLMVDSGTISTADSAGSLLNRLDAAYGEVMGWGENNACGCADAFGFISYWIGDTSSSKQSGTSYTQSYYNIISTEYLEYGDFNKYYISTGFSYNTAKNSWVTYATLDFWYF